METVKFRVKEVGLDATTIKYNPGSVLGDESFDYVYTSISANNDFLLPELPRFNDKPGNRDIITEVGSVKNLEYMVQSHLSVLGANYINIMLLSGSCDFEKAVDEIKSLQTQGDVINLGVANPRSVDDLERFKKLDLLDFNYVSIPISPLDFNYEVLEWCKANGKEVIGVNPFGGNLSAARNIESFTAPYLLRFISTYADIVILSGRDVFRSSEEGKFVKTLVEKDSSPMYVLKKSMYKPVKSLKKFSYTSIKLTDDLEVPFDEPDTVAEFPGYELSFGAAKKEILDEENVIESSFEDKDEMSKEDGVVKEISEIFSLLDYDPNNQDYSFALSRYKALDFLRLDYPAPDWTTTIAKIGNTVLTIKVERETKVTGHLWWSKIYPKEEHTFILSGFGTNFKFYEEPDEENSEENN